MLSTHDSAIVSLLKALRIDLPIDSVPYYGSQLCMETYVDPVTHASFLKFTLNGSPLLVGSCSNWVDELSRKERKASSVGDHLTPFGEVESIVRDFLASGDA